jgi:hypothetical protein
VERIANEIIGEDRQVTTRDVLRGEAEPIRVMIGNSSSDIQLTTEVRVQ